MHILATVVVGGIYLIGAYKFWSGFQQTNFNQNRFVLTAMWPIFIFNRSYRSNFMRALKG